MISQQKKLQHLFLRAGFGETPEQIDQLKNTSLTKATDTLFKEAKENIPLTFIPMPDLKQNGEVSNLKILLMILKSQQQLKELNLEWIKKMAAGQAALREKMTFFWHNHFSTSVPFAYLMQVQNNTMRKYALENFKDLLHQVAKDPAMIIYLNNQQNKKNAPNENFAREVMELFTLGEGHYTEKDIKEAARAFTGWTVNKKGEYEFTTTQHDDGEKEFLGKKGNFNGDDIINILLEQKQTAHFVVRKIYRDFVNYTVDEDQVEKLADDFFKSGYDISRLMHSIFTSEWFYDEKNIGCKISSPVELIVRYKKLVKFEFEENKGQFAMEKVLGQTLFFAPNVAGWKGGRDWIDSSSLMLRLNFPMSILAGVNSDLQPKPEFEERADFKEVKNKNLRINSDWSALVNTFSRVKDEELMGTIIESFIQAPTERISKKILETNTDNSTKEKRIVSLTAAVMSLPEFQLI